MPGSKLSVDRRIVQLEARLARVEALIDRHAKALEIQFTRTAQVQAELDETRTATENVKEWVHHRRRPESSES